MSRRRPKSAPSGDGCGCRGLIEQSQNNREAENTQKNPVFTQKCVRESKKVRKYPNGTTEVDLTLIVLKREREKEVEKRMS